MLCFLSICTDCDGGQCENLSRKRRSTLFKSLELQDYYNELSVRVASLEQKVILIVSE